MGNGVAAVLTSMMAANACAGLEPLSNAYSPMSAPVGERCVQSDPGGGCALYGASLLELIAVPERFHGKKVRVIGFVHLTFEGNSICPSQETVDRRDCIFLDIDKLAEPGFRHGYALLEGRFDGELRGHLGCCSGTILEISRFQKWE
jgi:hypothetical protein